MPIQIPHLEPKDYVSVFALLVSIVGWLVSYFFGQRAHKKNFLHQLTDRARMETTASIREAEDWLSKLSGWLLARIHRGSQDWLKSRETLRSLMDSHMDAVKWASKLEDYRLIFPECEAIRSELHKRHLPIQQEAWKIVGSLSELAARQINAPAPPEFLSKWNETLDLVMTQSALLDDLRVHLQNVALSRITGRSLPPRLLPILLN